MVEIYHITPNTKPRQTRKDKWEKRPCVMQYRQFADDVRSAGVKIPTHDCHVIFVVPMAPSWSDKKKAQMDGQPMQLTPDLDNLHKALLDSLFSNDCHIWDARITKLWGYSGKIIVLPAEPIQFVLNRYCR